MEPAELTLPAPAKLTLSLAVTGRRADGYHLLDAEMVTLDLADTVCFADGDGLVVVDDLPPGCPPLEVPGGGDNLVCRALAAVGRRAAVRLTKRIPAGAGLGGGSADAAAVLRWAACRDPAVAAGLGADVPFCLVGGRARVTGVGEVVQPLDPVDRSVVLLLPPLVVPTPAVYRAYDELGPGRGDGGNDLEVAALAVEPRLAAWRDALAEATGCRPRLAGSGSAWFVVGDPVELGVAGIDGLAVGGRSAPVVTARTTGPTAPLGPR